MKKFILLTATLFFWVFSAQAQLYVRAQVGYALPTSTEHFDINDVTQTSTSYSEMGVYSTTGGGFVPGIAVGYFFNNCLGVELAGQYLLGSKTSAEQNYANGSKVAMTRYTRQIRILPSLVVRCGEGSVKPYAKFGVLLPVGGTTFTELEQPTETPGGLAQAMYEIESNGSFSLGFASSIGAEFSIGDRMGVFAEIALQSLSIKGKTTEIVAASVGGTDVLATIPNYTKMTNYVDELTQSSNNFDINPSSSLDTAQDEIYPRSQYGSIGLNAGVVIYF